MSSDNNDEYSLEGLDDLDFDENGDGFDLSGDLEDDGFELDLSADDEGFSLSEEGEMIESLPVQNADKFSLTNIDLQISLDEDSGSIDESLTAGGSDEIDLGDELKDEFSLSDADDLLVDSIEEEISEEVLELSGDDEEIFKLSDDDVDDNYVEDDDLFSVNEINDPLKDYSSPKIKLAPEDLTEDVKAKLKEIDAIMEEDATNAGFSLDQASLEEREGDSSLGLGFSIEDDVELSFESEEVIEEFLDDDAQGSDESLVGDLNLSSLDLEEEEDVEEVIVSAPVIQKKKKKKEESGQSFDDISQAYTGEMARTHATISNLRSDRDELLSRIDFLEEEKLISHRSSLTLRAELDEKKIELTIIRKKLNDEINDLKDRVRIFEEKVLILEEKNKYLNQELDKAGQRNKIDVKKVMLRERELEQKLELLKADAETQIRNRDLKILELKRKVDGMEFDMDSMTQHEKKTLESRFELEDKLDKAIRTLRTAISSLEDDGDRSSTIDAIKKNIDM